MGSFFHTINLDAERVFEKEAARRAAACRNLLSFPAELRRLLARTDGTSLPLWQWFTLTAVGNHLESQPAGDRGYFKQFDLNLIAKLVGFPRALADKCMLHIRIDEIIRSQAGYRNKPVGSRVIELDEQSSPYYAANAPPEMRACLLSKMCRNQTVRCLALSRHRPPFCIGNHIGD